MVVESIGGNGIEVEGKKFAREKNLKRKIKKNFKTKFF